MNVVMAHMVVSEQIRSLKVFIKCIIRFIKCILTKVAEEKKAHFYL